MKTFNSVNQINLTETNIYFFDNLRILSYIFSILHLLNQIKLLKLERQPYFRQKPT